MIRMPRKLRFNPTKSQSQKSDKQYKTIAPRPSCADIKPWHGLEALETRVLLSAGAAIPTDPTSPQNPQGTIMGMVLLGRDANTKWDHPATGMPGITIYTDLNRNGIRDHFEPQTITETDNPRTKFDESGRYALRELPRGTYLVRQIVPSGHEQSFPSDPQGHEVRLGNGDIVFNINFHNKPFPMSSIHGLKWLDENGNGKRDQKESGLAGVTIYTDLNLNEKLDPFEPHTKTLDDNPITKFDETGFYWLRDLPHGFYTIREVMPDGLVQTFPGPDDGGVHAVTLKPGVSVDGIDFGNRRGPDDFGSIHGVKWLDLNGNGQRERNEPGLAGVTIYLDLNNNRVLDDDEPTTLTSGPLPHTDPQMKSIRQDAYEISRKHQDMHFEQLLDRRRVGHYAFTELDPGNYTVREIVPDGFSQTFPMGPIPLAEQTDAVLPPGGHYILLEAGDRIKGINFGNQPIKPGSIHGTKWADLNGNSKRDSDEPGLPGVLIYVDLNYNGMFDENEPHAITMKDIPETDFDEAGMYSIDDLEPGHHVVREVVPDGFRQTFPRIFMPMHDHEIKLNGDADPFATVLPDSIDIALVPGEIFDTAVSVQVHPLLLMPLEVNVVASNPNALFENLTGSLVNGGGGDLSTFQITLLGTHHHQAFDLQIINGSFSNSSLMGTIPVRIRSAVGGGSHDIIVQPGESISSIDFGNQPLGLGSVHGIKWLDSNGNGQRDDDEPGLPGVTIYSDINRNGYLDMGEPHTTTNEDSPTTLINEAGHYWLEGLAAQVHEIREVVPDGFMQTFPRLGAELGMSQTHDLESGIALDYDLTDVESQMIANNILTTEIEMTVVWPDSCGVIMEHETEYAVENQTVFIKMFGKQAGQVCAYVISPQSQTIRIEGLDPGKYTVQGTLHENIGGNTTGEFVPTLEVEGLFEISGHGHIIELHPSETVDGVDFGNRVRRDGSIHGIKWVDLNGDSQRSLDEPGLAGVTVYVDLNENGKLDDAEPHTQTIQDDPTTKQDETGQYHLSDLAAGEYLVREVIPEGSIPTFPLSASGEPEGHKVQLDAGGTVKNIDFGNMPTDLTGSIHGIKWVDLNGNGKHEPDEPGLAGVTIYLDINRNGQFDQNEPHTTTKGGDHSTSKDQTGEYSLNNVTPGFHIVREIVPVQFDQTFPEVLTCRAIFCTGRAHLVTVKPGEKITGIDFGNHPVEEKGSIHGITWHDKNNNGVLNDKEPGLPGVTVYLDLNRNSKLDDQEPHTQTIQDNPNTKHNEVGQYKLTDLAPGEYLVREIVPDGFTPTYPLAASGEPEGHRVQLETGGKVTGIDFGNRRTNPGIIRGRVWHDHNGNGQQDMHETGLLGATVFLDLNNNHVLDDNEPHQLTSGLLPYTDPIMKGLLQEVQNMTLREPEIDFMNLLNHHRKGHYQFKNLQPGQYMVRQVVPQGFIQTFPIHQAGHELNVGPGAIMRGIDFGNRRTDGLRDDVGVDLG